MTTSHSELASATSQKNILIIAGPNGAGKTTFATEFLLNEAGCRTFVNADMIAAGLNPFEPERSAVAAGRLMLRLIDDYVRKGETFAFETTLSGRGYARMIPSWQAQGYRVRLYFLSLPSPEMAIARVGNRVVEGGHDVPAEVVRRRFHAGMRNFLHIYRDLVDAWDLYDASAPVPQLIEYGGD
ncbi:MAG: zeta toxin family protein [Chloroflexi bacterium]|nr:zeta toxin family protein [Chloroflexota bacterium]